MKNDTLLEIRVENLTDEEKKLIVKSVRKIAKDNLVEVNFREIYIKDKEEY